MELVVLQLDRTVIIVVSKSYLTPETKRVTNLSTNPRTAFWVTIRKTSIFYRHSFIYLFFRIKFFNFFHFAGTTANQTLYHTIINDSTMLDSSSKVEDINSTKESTGISEPNLSSKKKRVRQRKKKFNNSDPDSNVAKKPRVVSNESVPAGKHIRFDAPDNDSDSSVNDNDNLDRSTLSNLSGYAKKTPMRNLDNLLALRQTSTPLTFAHRKTEPEKVKVKEASLVSLTEEPMSTSETKDKSVKMINGSSNKSNQSMDVDKQGAQVKVGDIVDFKVYFVLILQTFNYRFSALWF